NAKNSSLLTEEQTTLTRNRNSGTFERRISDYSVSGPGFESGGGGSGRCSEAGERHGSPSEPFHSQRGKSGFQFQRGCSQGPRRFCRRNSVVRDRTVHFPWRLDHMRQKREGDLKRPQAEVGGHIP